MADLWPAEARLTTVDFRPLERIAEALVGALGRTLSGEAADGCVGRVLKEHPEWGEWERRAAAEAVFGVSLWRRAIAFHASVSEGALASIPALALAHFARDLAHAPPTVVRSVAKLQPSELGPVRVDSPPWPIRLSCPDWLADHFNAELSSEAEQYVAALNLPGPPVARVNTLRIARDALLAELHGAAISCSLSVLSSVGISLHERPNIYGMPAHQRGDFEIQDEGSQLVGQLVRAKPGMKVLDLCAGNGGKTLQLAAQMENQGALYAFDVDGEKLERLRHRAERAGVRNLHVLHSLPDLLQVDKVLVDAPCSSLGALRRGPDVRFRISPSVLTEFVPVQTALLRTAVDHLAPSGQIIYATCTLNRTENEAQVAAFLSEHPAFSVLSPTWLPPVVQNEGALKCFPHRHGTDGFFGVVLERGAQPRQV